MKKCYLIFFLSILTASFLAAQEKPVDKPPVQQTPSKALPAKPQEKRPAAFKKKLPKKTSKIIRNKKPVIVHKKARSLHTPVLYGNEWINYTQKYYKIRVAQNGLYRVDSATLAQAGIPVNTIQNQYYQLYFRGQQQYIYVRGNSSGYLSGVNGNYIEFYGQYNDGTEDSTLYYNIKFLPCPYYSLYNDTSSYYLTWDTSTAGLRMTEQKDTNWKSYAAFPYVMTTAILGWQAPTTSSGNLTYPAYLQGGMYWPGAQYSDGSYTPNDPRFTQTSAWIPWNNLGLWVEPMSHVTYTTTVDFSNVYTLAGVPPVFMRTVVLGINSGNCPFSVSTPARQLWNNTMIGFGAFDLDTTFPAADINPTSPFTVSYYNNALTNDTSTIVPSYIYLNYPHTTNLGGDTTFAMEVPAFSTDTTFLEFSNFYSAGDSVWLYDLTSHNRFWGKPRNGGYWVFVPNSGGLKQCYLTSDYAVHKVTSLTPVGIGRNGTFTNFSSEPGDAYIIVTHPSLWTSAQSYAAYRNSTHYNTPYSTVLADIYELYDQFGYGVDYSPLGLRNFCSYAINKWTSPPSNLFIIGKGIHTPIFRPDTAAWTHKQFFVPSYGYPSSDVMLTAGLGGDTLYEPAIPTGRLAAQTNAEVTAYLSKVQTFESAPAAQWMKNVAHFAGGNDVIEEALFRNILDNYATTISDTLFGANVSLFQKSSPAPISSTLTDSIINLVNNGVSIMTFFGHASGSDWDESIDTPAVFANYGKYPLMIADACYSGDIFQPEGIAVSNVSEQWVMSGNYPGAIAFLASDYLGDPSTLNSWTGTLYDDIDLPFYRKPIGSIIQNTIGTWQGSSDPFMAYTNMEMTLHGDPAIRINGMDSFPDYAVTNQSIYFTPANVSVLIDSFTVNVIVSNYAEALNQIVPGMLTRTFPNGAQIHYPFTLTDLYYQDTVSIRVPVNQSPDTLGAGINCFSVYVDLNPSVDTELTYANNATTCVPLLISSEDITPVWPYDYAIISADTATLKASTNDPFAPTGTYIFEIDTSHSFNSPLYFHSVLETNSGGVIMASPYDDWGTTHYAGPVKHEGTVKPLQEKAAKGVKNKGTAVAAKGITGEKSTEEQHTLTNLLPEEQANGASHKPIAMQEKVQAPSGVIKGQQFNPDLEKTMHRSVHGTVKESFLKNTVYYWRVRRDTSDITDYPWVMSSFEYIPGKYGWGQSNFYQYDGDEVFNDVYNFITFDTLERNWKFNTNGHTLECLTYGIVPPNYDITEMYGTEYKIDDYVLTSAGCTENAGFYVAVIDQATLQPWSTLNWDFGEANNKTGSCSDYPDAKFVFMDDQPAQMDSLAKMLTSPLIPNGDYILVWTWINGYYKAPGLTNAANVETALNSLGCTGIFNHANPGQDSVPMIYFVQKGNPSSAQQLFGTNNSSGLDFVTVLKSNGTYGCITTPLIGPSARYDSLSWHQHSENTPVTDSTRLNVIGIQPSGKPQTLMSDVTPSVASLYLSSISASLFPYIQLQMYCKDTTHHNPAQMNWWRVFYQPVPEIAMNPNIYSYYHADTLQYGDVLNFQTTVQNISDWPIASTQLLTWTSDAHNNTKYYSPGKFVKPLNPGDTAKISFILPDSVAYTNNLKTVWFEVNPEDYPSTREEQYHFNDYAYKTFYSYGDRINPVLDVTFDGIHILNNDIVSPQPHILITFMDENKFLALNNANDFKVSLRNVTTNGPVTTIPYGSQLSFTPAVLPYNKCSLLYTPTLQDGTYELYVQGTDISGNPSALNSYTIDFQVINKSMITQVLNYPNPFTTSTRFVFILTGEQIPTTFKIQIMTVTGKIVREINEDEIGPIHIGRNITQYAWDGTDKYGSKLGNGVYLYRVVTSINGQGIDEFQQGYGGANVDQYFTQSWGKMYLMR